MLLTAVPARMRPMEMQDETDGDDDGSCHHRREEFHHAAHAKGFDAGSQDEIEKAGGHDADTGVWQGFVLAHSEFIAHGNNGGVAAQEGETGAQKCRYFPLREPVEQQGAQARKEERG